MLQKTAKAAIVPCKEAGPVFC